MKGGRVGKVEEGKEGDDTRSTVDRAGDQTSVIWTGTG